MKTMRWLAAVGIFLAVSLVVVAAFPWSDLTSHAHWTRVRWIPFASQPVRPRDVVGNLLLCAPLGAIAGVTFRRGVLVAVATALAVSLFVEAFQVYSHTRFPSATDVACNVFGAALGAVVTRGLRHLRRQTPLTPDA
jgi:glycopeptide antibiotics resistance protein